jgi:nitrous oxide reductase
MKLSRIKRLLSMAKQKDSGFTEESLKQELLFPPDGAGYYYKDSQTIVLENDSYKEQWNINEAKKIYNKSDWDMVYMGKNSNNMWESRIENRSLALTLSLGEFHSINSVYWNSYFSILRLETNEDYAIECFGHNYKQHRIKNNFI